MSDLPIAPEIQLIQNAISFAARMHQMQMRKDEKTPYIAHPLRVLMTMQHVFRIDDSVALAAAALHDTIEDTTADYDDLLKHFGEDVADAVAALTKDMRLRNETREIAYDEQLSAASWQARAVKLADVYDNFCDAEDSRMRKNAAKKIPRAIACAGSAPELAQAIKIVSNLLKS